MTRFAMLVLAGLGVLQGACSSSDTSNGTSSSKLQAPMLMHVVPMDGALHVKWMNMQDDCDMVDAESKMEGMSYGKAFSVPGSVDNKMDAAATDDMTYTYRLRCMKGSEMSDYSNEMSANPHDMTGAAGAAGK